MTLAYRLDLHSMSLTVPYNANRPQAEVREERLTWPKFTDLPILTTLNRLILMGRVRLICSRGAEGLRRGRMCPRRLHAGRRLRGERELTLLMLFLPHYRPSVSALNSPVPQVILVEREHFPRQLLRSDPILLVWVRLREPRR